MFRLVFEPKQSKSYGDYLPVLDKVYTKFNDFAIDIDNREIVISLRPNHDNGFHDWNKMVQCLQEVWDAYHLRYRFNGGHSSIVRIAIPPEHNVRVILV